MRLSRQLFPIAAPSLLATILGLAACSKDQPEPRRSQPPPQPPPSASASAKACATGGGVIQDAPTALLFPRVSGQYCIDPNGETRVFGEGGKKPLEAVCTEAFDGECEVYRGYGLRTVSTFHYVDGAGTAGSVEVVLSRFATAEGAYGMFTKRVVGDGDPAEEKRPRDLKLPGAAALGTGSAYLWKGMLLVELTYTNETESPKQLAESSDKILKPLATEVASKLPGPPSLPASAAALPAENRVPLGILFEPKDAFEVGGAGAGAHGFYRDGDKRYRVLAIARNDPEQAKDVLGSIAQRKGATKEKDFAEGGVRLMVGETKDAPRTEWILARTGKQLLGIGDEPLVVKAEMTSAERDRVCLSREQKTARLKALLASTK